MWRSETRRVDIMVPFKKSFLDLSCRLRGELTCAMCFVCWFSFHAGDRNATSVKGLQTSKTAVAHFV